MAVKGEGAVFELVRTPDGDREAWLGQRRMGVGGSDVAAIMGLSPWRGAYETWADKRGLAVPEDISGRPAVMWGNLLEPLVGEHYAELHPDRKVRRLNAVCRSIARPWAQASLDYEVWDPDLGWGVLEIKTAGLRSEGKWEDGVPLFYQTQAVHYMSVTGRPFADVAVLIGGQDYREYRIMRDEDDVRAVEEAVDGFWRMVEEGVAPDTDGHPGEAAALLAANPTAGDMVQVDGVPDAIEEYVAARVESDAAKRRLAAAADALMAEIGGAGGIVCDRYVVKWPRGKRRRLDGARLKAERPELYEEYQTEASASFGLRVTERK